MTDEGTVLPLGLEVGSRLGPPRSILNKKILFLNMHGGSYATLCKIK